jgi:hypothetical protein
MPIYIAVPLTSESTALDAAVEQRIANPADRHRLQSNRGWLIKFGGTTIELSNHLQITGQEKGMLSTVESTIVVPVTGYYGRGPTDMWEWLKTRFEQ